jgi:hypothetical protein
MIDTSGGPRVPDGNVANPGPILNDAINVNKHQEVYGEDPTNADPLKYKYLQGRWGGFAISADEENLTDNATNYIVVERSTGTLTVATTNTNWNNLTTYARVARIVLSSGARTDDEDFRAGPGGVHGQAVLGSEFTQAIIIAVSDESTALTTGTNKVRFRMPYAFTLTGVRASVNTAPTGAALIVDINEGGASILSTKLSIDATETTSTTAATPAVISDSALADDAEISIDIDQIGSTVAGAGLKVALIGVKV